MTSKENMLAKDMVELIKNIEEHTGRLGSGEMIPQLELELIVSKIKSLYEKSVILKYLHANNEEISNSKKTEIFSPIMPAEEVLPVVNAQINHPENIVEKKSLHDKISKTNVISGISLHEKLMFQKELFGGNYDDYETMIKTSASFSNFEETKKILEETFSAKYSWDKKSDALNVLWSILEKRFK